MLLDVNSQKALPMITKNFAGTTISHICTTDFNSGAMIIKCLSFDLAGKKNFFGCFLIIGIFRQLQASTQTEA